MQEMPFRQAAALLLDYAIRIAPPESREWGQAMRGELSFVEGHWAALLWAFGGASVMAKHALISLLIPGRRGQAILFDGGLFARNVSVRKVLQVIAAGLTLASLLFFAAPPFRQAVGVSLAGWNELLHITGRNGQSRLQALAIQAEGRRDPEGLVFAAARLTDDRESSRLVREAVQLNPDFDWAYAVVAVRHPYIPEILEWMPQLARRDPQNALLYFISAESIYIADAAKPSSRPYRQPEEVNPAWRSAMAAAFASPKFDDYLDRLRALDAGVLRRYGFNDPYSVLAGEEEGLPSYAFWDCSRFSTSILQSGKDLEARGDRSGAVERYWSVARFGQVIDSQAQTDSEHTLGLRLQAGAYNELQEFAKKGGNANEAALFAYLATTFGQSMESLRHGGISIQPGASGRGVSGRNAVSGGLAKPGERWVFGAYVSGRNALVLQVSSLIMVILCALLLVAASVLIAGIRQGGSSGAARIHPWATVLALISAVGLLLSSATIYLTYRPYWYIFQRAVLDGDRSQARDLREFLSAIQFPPGFDLGRSPRFDVALYFWAGVTLLAVAGLVLIILRHFPGRVGTNRLHNNPRVP
jgi:hypothetical protein